MLPSDASDPLAARLAALVDEHAELEARLADPDVGNDPAALRTVTTRYHELTPVVDAVPPTTSMPRASCSRTRPVTSASSPRPSSTTPSGGSPRSVPSWRT